MPRLVAFGLLWRGWGRGWEPAQEAVSQPLNGLGGSSPPRCVLEPGGEKQSVAPFASLAPGPQILFRPRATSSPNRFPLPSGAHKSPNGIVSGGMHGWKMENLESSSASQGSTEETSRGRTVRSPKAKRVIEGVTYIRDAFGCYVPESTSLVVQKVRVRTPKDALPALAEIRSSPQEIFLVLDLDGNNQIIEIRKVTVGLVNQSQIHPRETFRGAIQNNAVSILVAHNHPSGNLEPSESDLTATRRLVEVSKVIGIPILDHVIVSKDGFASLRERFPACFH